MPVPPATDRSRQLLLAAATAAAKRAYATRSGVHVGAAVLSAAGHIYSGCNVENAAFPLGNCAEPAAISAAVVAEGPSLRIAEVAVWAESPLGRPFPISPCGGCRQRISELARDESILVHFAWPGDEIHSVTLSELLPFAFTMAPAVPS